MKNLLYFSPPGAWYLLSREHPLWGSLLFALLGASLFFGYYKITQRRQLIQARERIEPVFVISLNPETDERVILGKTLDSLCVHVKPRRVMRTAGEWEDLLLRSGNKFAQEADPADRLPVVPILFQDGRNVNEEWHEFDERASLIIKSVRAEWHERLKEANKDWYLKHHHRQATTVDRDSSSRTVEW